MLVRNIVNLTFPAPHNFDRMNMINKELMMPPKASHRITLRELDVKREC